MDDYKTALLEIALGQAATAATATATAATAAVASPFLFVADLLTTMATLPITREGTERLLDTLFANPSFAPLLADPAASQADMAIALDLTKKPIGFQSYWTFIICPAWDQHAAITQALAL